MFRIWWLVWLALSVMPASWGFAEEPVSSGTETAVSVEVSAGLDYLLTLVGPESGNSLDMGRIGKVLEFTGSGPSPEIRYVMNNKPEMSTAFYQFEVRASLKRILDMGYHPDIPSHILSPSSIRLAYWKSVDGNGRNLPRISGMLPGLEKPVLIKGVEYEEITPDEFTGTYYGYDVHRTLALARYQGRNLLVSMSLQNSLSDVGKKGLVLGRDDNWEYLYSNDKGLNKPGLGWVSSYMYGAGSVMFFEEIGSGSPKVRISVFKWLRAGWAGMNMVQNRHIYSGMERFSRTFRQVVEHPSLPGSDQMAQAFRSIRQLSTDELRENTRRYLDLLTEKYGRTNSGALSFINRLASDEAYLQQLSREQMQAILDVEYLKSVMGKNQVINIGELLGLVGKERMG